MDAVLTYVAMQYGTQLTEFNSIIYAIMNTIGVGTTLFLKVVLCVGILWGLRKTKKEKLLVPLSLIFVAVALANLIVIRLNGIDV
jgi:inner membrane protein involved in colicin E2 resistance